LAQVQATLSCTPLIVESSVQMSIRGGNGPSVNTMDKGDGITDAGNQSTCTFESDGVGLSAMSSVPSRSSEAELSPLLKVSSPIPVGSEVGRYRIRIWRKSKRQPFGIQFSSSNGMIEIAEDLPHLGLRQFDEVINVNGMRARTVEECLGVLRDAALLDMILQHTELDGIATTVGEGFGGGGCWPSAGSCKPKRSTPPSPANLPLRTLLSCSRPQVLGEARREFELVIERKSLKQRFGVNFSAEKLQGSLMIRIAEDQPHLGLLAGDLLLSVNGVAMQNSLECQRLLEKSMIISLRLRRMRAEVVDDVALEDDADAICEEVMLESERPCSAVCG